MAAPDPPGSGKAPYVLITTDGHSIGVMEKPEKKTDRVLVHLAPAGQAAFYPAKLINWAATEKFNAPPPTPPAAKPEDGTPAFTPVQGATVTRDSKGLELKLIGNGRFRTSTETQGAAGGAEGTSTKGAPGAKPLDPNASAGMLVSLAREMADLKRVQADLVASKATLQGQLAELEAKAVNLPAQGVSDYQSPTQKAIEETKSQILAVDDRRAPIEKRMGEIRAKVIELGGSVD